MIPSRRALRPRIHSLSLALALMALVPLTAGAQSPGSTPKGTRPGTTAPSWRPPTTPERLPNEIPDTTIVLRVGDQAISVKEYISRYYSSYPENRPESDSLGRIEFLRTLENGLILARVARERNRPLDFSERATMRQHTARVLSNVLYKRAILDSVVITEAQLRELHSMLRTEIRLREMAFRTLVQAEEVRDLIVSRKLTWEAAYKQFNQLKGTASDGDIGWQKRTAGDPMMSEKVFSLQKGEVARPWKDAFGAHLVQCTDTRVVEPAPFQVVAPRLREIVRSPGIADRTEAISEILRKRVAMVYDTTNLVWTAQQFQETMSISSNGGAPIISISNQLPHFDLRDSSRVLARFNGGRFTLAQFVESYRSISAVARPAVNTPDRLRQQVDAVVLEPQREQLALERGYDKDPLAIEWIEKRREELLVDRLYQDSVQNYVSVSEADARKFYEQHRAQYITYPRVRYAVMALPSKASADSMMARLAAGERLDQIVRADSVARRTKRGSVREMRQNEEGEPLYGLLFQDLKPGGTHMQGPDAKGDLLVVQSLDFDPGRQLSFEEAYTMVDTALQNQLADRLLNEFIERQRRKIAITRRLELLQRFTMRDPSLTSSGS